MNRFEFNGIVFSKQEKYKFSIVEGLNEGATTRQTGQYLGQDGIDILSSNYEPRIVTISGHIIADSEMELLSLRQRLVTACNGKTKGILKYNCDYRGFFSEAVADLPQFGEKKAFCLPFSVDFTLYNFYWKGQFAYISNVFKRVDNLKGTFTFPIVFTTRINTAISGDLIAQGTYRYFVKGLDGQPLSHPTWVWMTDLSLVHLTKDYLLSILQLPAVAISGQFKDLINLPNRYEPIIILSGGNWDYSLSSRAKFVMTSDTTLNITNLYNGAVGTIDVFGSFNLTLPVNSYTLPPEWNDLTLQQGQHYFYSFDYDGSKFNWKRSVRYDV